MFEAFEAKEINAKDKDLIHEVAYDYNGDRMATCSSDQYVKVWDKMKEGKWVLTSSWKAHSSSLQKVSWAHPKYGQVLATCSFDRTAAVWEEIVEDTSGPDKKGSRHWVHRTNLADSKTSLTDVKFRPQHLQLATCSIEGIIRIYEALDVTNLTKWTLQQEIQCEMPLSCLDWSPSLSMLHPPILAVGSDSETGTEGGGKVFIYKYCQTGRNWIHLDTINSITEPVHDIAFIPNLERGIHVMGVASKNVKVIKFSLEKDESDQQSGQRILSELEIPIASQLDDDNGCTIRRVSWNVNGTVLASHGDDVCVRMFKSYPAHAELCLLPIDEDEASHQAIYYAIRSGNIELLNTLIDQWPGHYFSTHPNKLDEILSKAYEELKLKNVPLSEQIEFFVENKLIDLRFLSNSAERDSHVNGNLNNVKERIDLVLRNINDLKTEYLNTNSKVNEKFLFITKFIAQNIHVLKQQLKFTYDRLPWEEIEFCLIIFISTRTKTEQIHPLSRVVLNTTKILKHLENFAKALENEKHIIVGGNIDKLDNLPNIKREKVIAAIINSYSQFEELYNDYQQIRDIHSLEKISSYIKLALLADPKERNGQLIITRALQVTGEYLKNSLESPQLSNNTSELLLLSLTKNTREIIIGLRNSLSHANSLSRRIEIEENTDVIFFIGVQNDTKRIDKVIDDILYNNTIKTITILLKKFINVETLDEAKQFAEILNNLNLDKIDSGNFKFMEHENFEKFFKELSEDIIGKTDHQKQLFHKIRKIINSVGTRSENIRGNYISALSLLRTLSKYDAIVGPDPADIRGLKFEADRILKDISLKIEPCRLKEIAELSVKVYHSVQSEVHRNLREVDRLVCKMFYIAEFEIGDLKYIAELRGRLNAEGSFIPFYNNTKASCNLTAKEYHDQFTLKLSELKNILNSNLLTDQLTATFQAVVEMLVLDLLSILFCSGNYLANNLLSLEDNTPVLYGKCLHNYLAYGNALVDVLFSDPSIAIISNARKLISENVLENRKIIGKLIRDDPSELKGKYDQGLAIIGNQERMFAALEDGNHEELKRYLKKGGDIRARDINSCTTLHFAAKGPSLEIIKSILDTNVSPNDKNANGHTPLHVAAAHGRKNIVEFFLKEAGLYVDDQDKWNKTALHMAAQNGFKDTVEILLENKANTMTVDVAKFSPLNYAICNNHIDIVKILLGQYANVDIDEANNGLTLLLATVGYGNIDIVNLLLQNNANVNAKDERDWTSLHAASLHGHLEVVEALILKGAHVNVEVLDGSTPLHYAALNGHEKVANIILKHGANVNAADKVYNTPLHYAAKYGYEGIVKSLLKNKANPCVRTIDDVTPLHLAAQSGYLEIVRVLVNYGVNIHAKEINNATSLHYAAESGRKEVVELLVKNGADVNAKKVNYISPLHTAALNGHRDVIDLLVEYRASVKARDINRDTPLHAAAMNGSKDIVDILIKNKSEVNARNNYGLTPLHSAVTGGHKDVINLLIKNRALVDAKGVKDGTALHFAVEANSKEMVEILVTNGANVNIKGEDLPLISAVRNNNKDIVKVLVANGADVNADCGKPISLAVFSGNRDIVEILLKHEARIDMKDPDNITFLHLAAERGHKNIVNALIENKSEVNALTINGTTPLHLAAQEGHEEVVNILIENGANVNIANNIEAYPLHVAAVHNHDNVVKVLLNNGAQTDIKDNNNRTALDLAVAHGSGHVVKILLQYQQVDLSAKTNGDWPLLHIASQGTKQESNLEMVKYLVNEGADINARNASGSKAIHIAAREGHLDIVEYFLSKGLSVNELGTANQTLIHYAAMKGHLEVVKFLTTRGADVNAKDANDSTAMHMAAACGFKDFIAFLLKSGAVYNAVDKSNRTPMEVATDKNVIGLLTSTDQLFEAVIRNRVSDVENCIKEGASVNAKNSDIVTPLHYAAWKGYDRVVNVLLKYKASSAAVGKQGVTPLHYAAKFSHLKVVNALLSNGAVFNALSDCGKTPSDLTVDKDITSLFKIVSESFKNVKNDRCQVVNVLSKIKNIDKLKAIMNACDRENKTLVVAAIHNNFSKVEELKEISQGDVGSEISVALMLLSQGDYHSPLSILKSAFEKRKGILGPDSPGTLDIQAHIATALYKQGAYQEALKLLNELFQKRKRILGLNHKDTLNTRGSIALVFYRQGKFDEASTIYQEIYRQQKDVLEPNHSDILNTQFNMALVLDGQGKYEEALNMYKAVYEKMKETLGINHPTTISAQNNIAMVLGNQAKYEEALQLYAEVYKRKKRILGINHSETVRTLNNIATILSKQDKHEEAMEAFQKILKFQKEVLGHKHPETLYTQCNLASVLFEQRKWIGALKMYRECFDKCKCVFGSNSALVLDISHKIDVINMMFRLQGTKESQALQHLRTEFNTAARNGDEETIHRLLKDGIDINDKDNDGRTPLHYAISSGQQSIVNILLKNKADVTNVTKKGNTPLHTATFHGNKEIIEVLLQHVSRDKLNNFINAKTTSGGTTSLHVAAKNGSLEIIKSLLKHGATYAVKNNEGKKPLDLSRHQSVTDLLTLVEELFREVKKGNIEIIDKLSALKSDELFSVTNARNIQGNTLLQVAIANNHKNIASKLLKILKI